MAEPGPGGQHAGFRLSPGPEVVPAARRFVRDCLTRWRLQPDLGSDAALLVSELVTNALRHGPPPRYLDVSLHGDRLRISVADSSRAEPRPLPPRTWSEGGRGVALMEAVATEWGIEVQPPGKWVWCELRRNGPGPG